jgi:hypothetical protein
VKIHPNDEALELLLSLGEQHRSLVRYHLTWCGYCRSRLVYLPRPLPLSPETGKGAGPGYDQTVSASRRSQGSCREGTAGET